MKPWLKWTATAVVVGLLVAGGLRTLAARKAKQAALQAQQTEQMTQVSIALLPGDLVQVKTLDLALQVAISGPVRAVNTAVVKARIPGELQGLTVREGDRVKVGQVLGHIDPTESDARLRQARQQAQAAKAQVDMARRTQDNNEALVAQGFISSTALASSQTTLAAAQANYAAARSAADVAAKNLSDTVLRAPLSGQIAQRLAQPGERVGVDARIVEIVDLSRLELEAALSATDALQVKVGQVAQLRPEGASRTVTARVVRISPSVSAGSRAVLVYLALESAADLRQGMFLQGLLATGTLHATAIPLSAMRTDKPQPYVQVVQGDQVSHRNIEPGARSEADGQTLVAISGAPEGTTVIAGSVGVLREGTRVKLAAAQPGAQ